MERADSSSGSSKQSSHKKTSTTSIVSLSSDCYIFHSCQDKTHRSSVLVHGMGEEKGHMSGQRGRGGEEAPGPQVLQCGPGGAPSPGAPTSSPSWPPHTCASAPLSSAHTARLQHNISAPLWYMSSLGITQDLYCGMDDTVSHKARLFRAEGFDLGPEGTAPRVQAISMNHDNAVA